MRPRAEISRIPGFRSRRWQSGGVPAVLAAVLVASCAGGAPDRPGAEYLDESTGTTITRVAKPIILFSEEPTLGANVRDYIYAAPLAVNQTGQTTWWLWLSQWSTIDRGVTLGGSESADVVGILFIVDGEPMELDPETRVAAIPGVHNVPYAAPVTTARNFFFPLTGSQVERLGRAGNLAIRTETAGGGTRLWHPWTNPDGRRRDFADIAPADPPGAPVIAGADER